MLHDDTRMKLVEHNWLDFENNDKNHYQTWARLKQQYLKAISDMTLLAQKLPDEKFDDMFTAASIEPFVMAVLKPGNERWGTSDKLEKSRTRLCAMLIERCVHFCILQIHLIYHNTPSLKEPVVRQLIECISICKDIANKIELDQLTEIGNKESLEYLFDWSKVLGDHKSKLSNLLTFQMELAPYYVTRVSKSPDGNSLLCVLEFKKDRMFVSIAINDYDNKGVLILRDHNKAERQRIDLIVKEEMKSKQIYRLKGKLV